MSQLSTIELTGPPSALIFPDMCVSCGLLPAGKVHITKVFFYRYRRRGQRFRLVSLQAPVCLTCLDRHEREQGPLDPALRRRVLRGWALAALPMLLPVAGVLAMLALLGPTALDALRQGGGSPGHTMVQGLLGLLAAVVVGSLLGIWYRGRRLWPRGMLTDNARVRRERGPLGSRLLIPVPATAVSAAVDFSRDRGQLFDTQRYSYTFQLPHVAAEVLRLNTGRVWNPQAPRAVAARWLRWGVFGALMALGAVQMLRGCLADLAPHALD